MAHRKWRNRRPIGSRKNVLAIENKTTTERKTMKVFTIILTVLAFVISLPACSKKDDTKKKDDGHTDHTHP
jgi:hypothetical protein